MLLLSGGRALREQMPSPSSEARRGPPKVFLTFHLFRLHVNFVRDLQVSRRGAASAAGRIPDSSHRRSTDRSRRAGSDSSFTRRHRRREGSSTDRGFGIRPRRAVVPTPGNAAVQRVREGAAKDSFRLGLTVHLVRPRRRRRKPPASRTRCAKRAACLAELYSCPGSPTRVFPCRVRPRSHPR